MKKTILDYPDLLKEWHPTKNGDLTPADFTHGSAKKVWWLCRNSHSFFARVCDRILRKTSCPECYKSKIRTPNTFAESLIGKFPDIAKEWHPTKNGDLTPDKVFPKSEKRAWFQCSKVSSHEWEARLADRTSKNSGCPYCYRRVTPETSLAAKFPEIAKDWHPTKNGDLTPDKVAPKSNKKFWWICSKGHDYELAVVERTNSHRGCTECARFGGSAQETRLYTELKSLFTDVEFRHKIEGVEIDVFITSIGVGIEYDGVYYHHDKIENDIAKNDLLEGLGFKLIRMREEPLEQISPLDIVTAYRSMTKEDMNGLMKSIQTAAPTTAEIVSHYLKEDDFVNNEEFAIYMSYFPSPFPEKSLAETFPEVAAQWDFERNYPLTPYNFTHGSKHKVYWICEYGHSTYTTINAKTQRANGRFKGCIECKRKRNSLDQLDMFE